MPAPSQPGKPAGDPADPARSAPPIDATHAAANGSVPAALPAAPPAQLVATAGAPAPAVLDREQRLLNRDLSWLEFNRRVLAQATDPRTPLLTRIHFLTIFSSNIDEFFMKRVGYIKLQIEAAAANPSAGTATPDGLTPTQLLFAIRSVVTPMHEEQARLLEQELLPALAQHGIVIMRYADLNDAERLALDQWYTANVFPVLTPLAVDPGHRFPFISNLSESVGVMVSSPGEDRAHFARVKIPDTLPRLLPIPDVQPRGPTLPPRLRFIALDELIRNNLDDLFPGMAIRAVLSFRVTRNAAVQLEEDDDADVLESVENELRLRRFARAVRLEVGPEPNPEILGIVRRALRLEPPDVYERHGPLEYSDLSSVSDLPRPELKEPRYQPAPPPRLANPDADIFAAIRERDILLHHPYESFTLSVERFIAAAARDPDVLAIKQTIYRTSPDSPFVQHLVRAAEAGKQVACLVELRARFDEHKNVKFAAQLEKAGVHVAYGVVGYKTHCKTSLVVRQEADAAGRRGVRCYAHVGTGNYNPSTAQLYTDLGLLTCNRAITEDLVGLFNFLTGRSLKREYAELLVAPFGMRAGFMQLIDREIANAKAGRPARIVAKMNSLEDLKITNKLYEASAAGVDIRLIVRGFCCLRPGVPGLSENIRVQSVIGRFLEHSRLFYFADGHTDPVRGRWYIGSGDWMYRNLSVRVEAACPVYDEEARRRLARLIDVMLADHRCAWDLRPDGSYYLRRPPPNAAPDSPEVLGTFQALIREASAAPAAS